MFTEEQNISQYQQACWKWRRRHAAMLWPRSQRSKTFHSICRDSHTKRPITKRPITKFPITQYPITKWPSLERSLITKCPITKGPITKCPMSRNEDESMLTTFPLMHVKRNESILQGSRHVHCWRNISTSYSECENTRIDKISDSLTDTQKNNFCRHFVWHERNHAFIFPFREISQNIAEWNFISRKHRVIP
jgi:hypothetical protein